MPIKKKNVPKNILSNSIDYGKTVASHILEWASKDSYKELRSYPKYSIPEDISKWQPTPPRLHEWNRASLEYDKTIVKLILLINLNLIHLLILICLKKSFFYKELLEVYNIGISLKERRKRYRKFLGL